MENTHQIQPSLKARPKWANALSWLSYSLIFLFVWVLLPLFVRLFKKDVWIFSRLSSLLALKSFGIHVAVTNSHADKILESEPLIYFANHGSWFDQVALCVALPRSLAFLSHEKYFRTFPLSIAMRLYGHIPIKPKADAEKKIKEGEAIRQVLREGRAVVVFPEGTRTEREEKQLRTFRKGIFALAAQERVRMVPVHIIGAKDIYPRKSPLLQVQRGTISVVVGAPLPITPSLWTEEAQDIEANFKQTYQSLVTDI